MLRRFIFILGLALIVTGCQRSAPDSARLYGRVSEPTNIANPMRVTPNASSQSVPQAATASALLSMVVTTTPSENTSPTETPASTPSPAPAPTHTALPFDPAYSVQTGSPVTMTNFLHPESACSWAGVTGQVFDHAGVPVEGLVVQVSGNLDGSPVDVLSTTGAAEEMGPGGYEVVVSNGPVQHPADLQVQILGQNGTPLSDPVAFQIPASCEGNLVLINFVTGRTEEHTFFIPLTLRGDIPVSGSDIPDQIDP